METEQFIEKNILLASVFVLKFQKSIYFQISKDLIIRE
jgi:hypothetical protein